MGEISTKDRSYFNLFFTLQSLPFPQILRPGFSGQIDEVPWYPDPRVLFQYLFVNLNIYNIHAVQEKSIITKLKYYVSTPHKNKFHRNLIKPQIWLRVVTPGLTPPRLMMMGAELTLADFLHTKNIYEAIKYYWKPAQSF